MLKFPVQKVDLIGLEWVKLEISLWLHFHLPSPLDLSVVKKVRKHILRLELPYDELLLKMEPNFCLDVSQTAAVLFFHEVGNKVIDGYVRPSLSVESIRNILFVHLNKHQEKIASLAQSFTVRSNEANDSHLPESPRANTSEYKLRSEKQHLCTRVAQKVKYDLPEGRAHDDHIYTSALKEMGDAECRSPEYALIQLGFDPPRWRATAQYNGVESFAEASTKRAAKHSASKTLWLQMGRDPIFKCENFS